MTPTVCALIARVLRVLSRRMTRPGISGIMGRNRHGGVHVANRDTHLGAVEQRDESKNNQR